MRCSHPDLRAVIGPAGIVLHAWHPGLVTGGPALRALDDLPATVVLADLTIVPDEAGRELIARYVAPRDGSAAAQDALLSWAQRIGYRRVWFADRVLALEPGGECGELRTTCGGCGLQWRDDGDELWSFASEYGYFPTACPACGACMPEWVCSEVGTAARDGQPVIMGSGDRSDSAMTRTPRG